MDELGIPPQINILSAHLARLALTVKARRVHLTQRLFKCNHMAQQTYVGVHLIVGTTP